LAAGFGRSFNPAAGDDGKASVRVAGGGAGGVIVLDDPAPVGCCWGGGTEPEFGVAVDGWFESEDSRAVGPV
jgi:hypothetical protein